MDRLMPGLWADDDGNLHADIAILCAFFGWPNTPSRRAEVLAVVRDAFAEHYPNVPIVEVEDS